MAVLMFGLHPFSTSTGQLLYKLNNSEYSEMVVELVDANRLSNKEIQAAKINPNDLPNVLMIYLESLERTYFDDRYYENLLTGLERLTLQGEDFTEVTMPWGATHTIAGMVASLCGVPINTPRGGKHQHGDSDVYMPQAQCLNDVTKSLGYDNIFYQGARLNFSNKGGFMRAHGYEEVKGFAALKDKNLPKSGIGPWGLHDDILIEKVNQRLEELLRDKTRKPFFFTMLTLDTHDAFGKGRYSKWCTTKGVDNYVNADHKVQHAVYCSDKLISEFIKDVLEKWGEDLIVIMMSDHAAYPFNMGDKLKKAENQNHRKLIFTIFDSDKKPAIHQKQLSTLDLGATILGYITNNKLNNIGLGVSGYKTSSKTLVEQLGQDRLDAALQSSNLQLGKALWAMPSFAESDINIDPKKKSVTIASNRYAMPVALMLDKSGSIVDFYGKDAHQKMALLKVSPRLVWIAQCKYIKETFETEGADNDICLVVGNLHNKAYYSDIATNSTALKYEDYRSFLDEDPGSEGMDLANQRLYQNTNSESVFEVVKITPSKTVGEFAIVDISSTMNMSANLVHHTTFPTMKERLNLEKRKINQFGYPSDDGLYLLEISEGNVNVLYHWKTCAGKNAKDFGSINNLLEKHKNSPALILTSARRVKCDEDDLRPYFSNSPFELAASLKHSQPYIAYLEMKESVSISVVGQPGENIKLRLINKELF